MIRLFGRLICALMALPTRGQARARCRTDPWSPGDRVIVELKGCDEGRLLADSTSMGQAIIVAASSAGQVPSVGETFRTMARSRVLTYRADDRRPHSRGWLVTLSRVD